jgi:molybdopterin molybdotransferase
MISQSMISVEEALDRVLALVGMLGPEEKPILDAVGQVLAEDVVAGFNIPPLDNTAMDGYACRAADTTGASPENPVRLRVVGELGAGYLFDDAIEPGTALRIMTGAPMPRGADTIVPFEETDEAPKSGEGWRKADLTSVGILKAALPGNNVRAAGEDVRQGEVILRAGHVVRPAEVGVLASLNRATVRVTRRPVVAILSTGDEILELGEPIQPGKIYDSNGYSLTALTIQYGGIPRRLGVARDTIEALTQKVRAGLRGADMLITSAGVSRGDYDVVKDVLMREGDIDFWTVRMRPGKPLAFGAFTVDGRKVPHIGLPGNPVSSMMTYELFGRPAIYKLMGRPHVPRPTVRAIALDRIENTDGRRFYARCVVTERDGRYETSLTGPQGSGILTSMAYANGLAVCPEDVPAIEPGQECEVIMLDWRHDQG